QRLTGVTVTAGDFDEVSLGPHLRANLRLLDRDGRSVLAESRDLDVLRSGYGARAARALGERAAEGMAGGGFRGFPAEPIPESVPGTGGVPAYPALRDDGDAAALDVHADLAVARRLHPGGVRRLLRIALQDKAKQARKQLPVPSKTALLYAAIESAAPRTGQAGDRLRDDLVEGALAALLAEGVDGNRDTAACEARRDANCNTQ